MIIAVVIAFVLYGIYQIPRIVKKKHWSDLIVFSFFFAAAFLLSAMFSLGIEIPSPYKAVEGLLNALNLHY